MDPHPTIRELLPEDDLDALTDLLHRAYATLAERGLRYLATHQDVATTRRRIEGGEAYVAVADGEIVGTIVWYRHHAGEPDGSVVRRGYYARPGVAAFGQFGVEPELRGRGIGRALLQRVEQRAREGGATELACDTAEPATDVIAMYVQWGYAVVDATDHRPHTNYPSVVLSKKL